MVVALLATSSVAVVRAKPGRPTRPEKLDQVIFVHPAAPDKPRKPPAPPGKPPKEGEKKVLDYYELWGGKLAETAEYYINNPNVSLVTEGDPISAVEAAAEAWDAVTADKLFSYGGTTEKRWYAEDGVNTVSWVKFTPGNYIAVVVMWYNPETMIIWEFDIVFNTFHRWGIDLVKEDKDTIKRAFDIQNIATHEFGHPVGLDDLYDKVYSELTMYGYSSKGETKKCSLEIGDIAGAQCLYGAP